MIPTGGIPARTRTTARTIIPTVTAGITVHGTMIPGTTIRGIMIITGITAITVTTGTTIHGIITALTTVSAPVTTGRRADMENHCPATPAMRVPAAAGWKA